MARPPGAHGEVPVPSQRVEIPWPEIGAGLHLRLSVGACRLRLSPGDGASWAEGTYADPAGALPLDVRHEDGTVRITQVRRFAEVLGLIHGVPTLDLVLGKARPFALTVESGASEVALELGGVPLERLVLRLGAGKATCGFGAPHPSAMERIDVTASGAALALAGLGHAGFAEMAVSTGAASCDLDFSGPLRRDGRVRVSAGVATVRISVPRDTAARIVAETALGGLDLGDGFTKRQGAFWTEGAVAGRTPALDVEASVSVGSLELRVR